VTRTVRSRPYRLVAVALLVAALASAVAPQASATTSGGTGGGTGGITRQQLQREVERTLEDAGYIGLSVEVRDGDHRIRARAGEAVLDTGRPVPFGGSLRAGSATKSFVATVVLQLIAEGRLSLDDTVEEWLPGVVTGNGNDGGRITIRHLLQHTSGIHNYTPGSDTEADFERARFTHFEPEQLVAGAMHGSPDGPGPKRSTTASSGRCGCAVPMRRVTTPASRDRMRTRTCASPDPTRQRSPGRTRRCGT
jgi:D-alanyl-D-alanine carboxypeptidase